MRFRKTVLITTVGVVAVVAVAVNQSDGLQTKIVDAVERSLAHDTAQPLQDAKVAASGNRVYESAEAIAALDQVDELLLDLEGPETTQSHQCKDIGNEMLCGDFNDPDWIELLDDESLFQVGLTDGYAANVAAQRLWTKDPDRAFEYSLRSVALSGKVKALQGRKQPGDGVEHTDELFDDLEMHSAVVSQLWFEIVSMNGYERSVAAPPLHWDTYAAANPHRYDEMQTMLDEFKTFIDRERETVIGEKLFAKTE